MVPCTWCKVLQGSWKVTSKLDSLVFYGAKRGIGKFCSYHSKLNSAKTPSKLCNQSASSAVFNGI